MCRGAAAHRANIRYMIEEVMHGHISTDTSSQAVAARKMALTVTADLPGTRFAPVGARTPVRMLMCAPSPHVVPDVDVSDCHELFRDSYRGFYSADPAVVDGSVDTALTTVQAAKERRPLACQGSGLRHMMKVLREAPNGSPAQLTAVRLCAEAALHDDTEVGWLTGQRCACAAATCRHTAVRTSVPPQHRTCFSGQAPWRKPSASRCLYVCDGWPC